MTIVALGIFIVLVIGVIVAVARPRLAEGIFTALGIISLVLVVAQIQTVLTRLNIATTEVPSPLSGLVPYIVGGVLIVIAIVYLVALYVLFLRPGTSQTGTATADTLVKTLTGFFTGLVMGLLGIK